MGLLDRIKQRLSEASFGIPKPTDIKEGVVLLNPVHQTTWIRPPVSFRNQIIVFKKDALVRQACIRQALELVGSGYFTQIAEDYMKVRLPSGIKGIKDWNAKEAIDYFNKANNIDERLNTVAIEMVAYGNSFWHITNGIQPIPLEAVDCLTPVAKTVPIKDQYDILTTADYNAKKLKNGTFTHFRCNVTTESLPFGEGLVAPLMQTYTWIDEDGDTVETPTPLQLRHSTRRSMEMGFRKFSFGNEMICVPEASDKLTEKLNEKAKNMKDTGERIVTNTKGSWQIAVPQRTTSYDEWLKSTRGEFNSLLEDPALKIHTETIFAKATAEEETKLFQKSVLGKQRIIKREMEALWDKWLFDKGFDPYQAQARMNFGVQEVPDYKIQDILKATETLINGEPLISREEARQMLREARWKIVEGGKA